MSNADIRGRFIWHELMTTDTDAAAAFYSKVVPWKTQDSGMPSYRLWMAGKNQVGGLTGLPSDSGEAPPHWIVYVATPDVDATVAEAERLGGKVLKGTTDIPNMGRYAVLTDPQGATFAVYSPPGPPPDGAAASDGPGEFTWHELATTDQDAALSFYMELFGWEKGPAHDMGGMGTYQLIKHDGAEVGGVYTLQAPSTPPHWLSYVQVGNCSKATTAAEAAGGRVLNGPMEVPGGSWITQIADPQGGVFAVVQSPKAAAQRPAAKKSSGRAKAAAKADVPPSISQAEMPASETAPAEPVPTAGRRKAPRKAAKKAVRKKTLARKSPAKSTGRKTAAKKAASRKGVAKARPVAKSASAKRGKAAPKKKTVKRAAGKKAKRR